jgi:hypothetical protein
VFPWFFSVIALLLLLPLDADASLRCGGNLVSIGDAKIDLLARCGSPTLQDSRQEERTTRVFDRARKRSFERTVSIDVDLWTYNFGPSQFLHFIRLENGRVSAIERGGYGYVEKTMPEKPELGVTYDCEGLELRRGDSMAEVLYKCGSPVLKETREETRTAAAFDRRRGRHEELRVKRYVDEWTYNFGPGRFVYFLRFEEGKLTDIRTGGYGYPAD